MKHAQIIRSARQGLPGLAIAEWLHGSEKMVRKWLKRFNAQGLEEVARPGRLVTYQADEVSIVIEMALTKLIVLGQLFASWMLDRLVSALNEVKVIAIKRCHTSRDLLDKRKPVLASTSIPTSLKISTFAYYRGRPKMKHQHMHSYESICLCVLIILSMLASTSCTNSNLHSEDSGNRSFPTAMPPSIPLICPDDQRSTRQDSFVGKNGTTFIYHSTPLKFYGYTFYPSTIGGASAWHTLEFTHYIDHILDMGVQAGQNLIRPTDFWDQNDHNQKQDDGNVWKNVDYLVCAARQRGMFVVLDLSAFGKFLMSQKYDPYDARNWKLFLEAVGKHYKNQDSIAFYSILGEPSPPTSVATMNKLVDFYRTVTDTLRQADENHHLIIAGGFNHMEEETPEIPWWHKIYSLPNNDIVAFKTYSLDDLHLIPKIAAFSKEIGKPLIDEEFGLPQGMGDNVFAGGDGYNKIRTSRAQFYQDVYNTGEEYGVTGFVFWDMGCELQAKSYQVNPNTPAVWQVIQRHAPNKPSTPDPTKPLCSGAT